MLSDGSKYTSGEYFVSWKIIEYNQSINRTQGDVVLWNTDIFSHLTATSPQRILAYIQALIIDSISIPVEDSINTRALAHEWALVHKYSKVKSEKFTKHLQSVLTTFYVVNYEDIKLAPAVAPSPSFWRADWWSMTTQRWPRTAPARCNRLDARGQRRRHCGSRRRHRRGRRGRRRRGNRAISCPRSLPLPGKPATRPGKGARASGGKSWAGCHWQLNWCVWIGVSASSSHWLQASQPAGQNKKSWNQNGTSMYVLSCKQSVHF